MSEWVWTNEQAEQSIGNYSFGISFISIFAIIYFIVILLIITQYAYNPQLPIILLTMLVILAIFIALAIHLYLHMRSIRRITACLRRVEIKGKSIILDTINGMYTAKLDEVSMCYKAILGRGFRPIAYNVFIKYQGLAYEIPELMPENFGALRQVLRGYGVDLNECTNDLSKYVCMGQSQQQW